MKGQKVSGSAMPAGTIHELIDSYCELNVSFTAAHHSVQVDSKGELRS